MEQGIRDMVADVRAHLLRQNERSIDDDGRCMYRHGARMCAVGCLIPDSMYTPAIEGLDVDELRPAYLDHIAKSYGIHDRVTMEYILRELQNIHDQEPTSYWEAQISTLLWRYIDG